MARKKAGKGVGTGRFGDKNAPTSAWNSTVPQASAGSGDYPFPDKHSTVPSGSAGAGDTYSGHPTKERSTVPVAGAGAGDYPVPDKHSTVDSGSAGSGDGGPREYDPAYPSDEKFLDYTGGDGGSYNQNQVGGSMPVEYSGGGGYGKQAKTVDLEDEYGETLTDYGYETARPSRGGTPRDLPGGRQYPVPAHRGINVGADAYGTWNDYGSRVRMVEESDTWEDEAE